MSESNDFTQNYSIQNKSSLKQTNKELLNCRFELIPLKTDWQKRLLSATEASLRENSPFRKRSHTRAARARKETRVRGTGQREGVPLLFLHPSRLRRSVARSLATRVARHEWPGACSQAVRTRNSRTQGLVRIAVVIYVVLAAWYSFIEPQLPTVSVKFVATLYLLHTLPMLVCQIWWGNGDKQRTLGGDGPEVEKQRSMEVSDTSGYTVKQTAKDSVPQSILFVFVYFRSAFSFSLLFVTRLLMSR